MGAVALVVAVVAFGVAFFHGGVPGPAGKDGVSFGGIGQNQSFKVSFQGGAVLGGKVVASSTVVTQTLAKTDIFDVAYFNAKAAAAATLTFPTKASLGQTNFIPNAGDKWIWQLHASTSAVTLAGNTGVTLRAASSTKINAGQTGTVIFTRLPKTEGSTIDALLYNY